MDKNLNEYIELIKNYVSKNYKNNFREPNDFILHRFLVPGAAYAQQLWDWDSWLTGVALMDIDDPDMFDYQTGCVINFLEHMDKFGRMPILLEKNPRYDVFILKDDKDTNCHKPCLIQHALEICKHYRKTDWIKDYFPTIDRYIAWYESNCKDGETGLFYWIDDFAIGFDNDPTVFYRPNKSTGAIYLNSLMYAELEAISELAGLCDLKEKEEEYRLKAEDLKRAIREECYDDVNGFFYSADLSLRKIDPNEWLHSGCPRNYKSLPIKIDTWAGFMPLWNKVATAEQAKVVVEKHYLNKETLNSDYGVRSVSRKEKMYAILRTGNPSCWLGPIWIVANYMTYVGLKNYGYDDLAKELAVKTICLLGKDLKDNGEFHEYYNPETGLGVNNKGFQSWNFLVIKMIKDLEDEIVINQDFLNNTVDAATQVKCFYYKDKDFDESTNKVMFIGNSITLHEKKPEIGWNRNCGMAASSLDKDYVHIVSRYIKSKNNKSSFLIMNGGKWEMDYTNKDKLNSIIDVAKENKVNTVVVRIGENFNKEYIKDPNLDPYIYFDKLFTGLKEVTEDVIATSLFWRHSIIDEAIKKAALKNNVRYVAIDDLGNDDTNKAIGMFEHSGVAAHPGDLGMQRIAERIIKELK